VELAEIRDKLLRAFEVEPVTDPKSIMFKTHASNGWVIILTAVAMLGIMADLSLIWRNWEAATEGRRTTESVSATVQATQSPKQSETANKQISLAPKTEDDIASKPIGLEPSPEKTEAGSKAPGQATPIPPETTPAISPAMTATGTGVGQSPSSSQRPLAKQPAEKADGRARRVDPFRPFARQFRR
jgi:hypothetical protein